MGFFDRLAGKKTPSPPSAPPAAPPSAAPEPKPAVAGGVMPRLVEARSRLDAKDLPAAMAIYEEVLAVAGDRADVLVTISGDLGVHGHVHEIINLVALRYDAQRHGPATGLNLLQAYIVVRQVEAAQHLLDVLFSLGRPELEERLFGFSNVISELMAGVGSAPESAAGAPASSKKINLVSISKPIWLYGLEEVTPPLLPPKEGRLRRVAFAQLSLPGEQHLAERLDQAEEELGRLSRALPLWMAETFAFSAGYEAIAVLGLWENEGYALLGQEWAAENIRQLNDSNEHSLDYVVTGYLRQQHADYELCLRIWEVKKFRELKALTTRWTPVTAEDALRAFHEQVRAYMEWTALPAGHGLAYTAPNAPLAHLGALGASGSLFLADKGVLPKERAPLALTPFGRAVQAMPDAIVPQLALVTALLRAKRLGETVDPEARQQAQTWLGSDVAKVLGVSGLAL
jgi:hypothetical protein